MWTINFNRDRLSSILSWRCPRSIPELSSRLSSLQYYESNCPFMKRIAYPLYDMVKKNVFQRTRIQSHAWGNILFLMALSIRCRGHLLTVSQRRQSPIHKEADGVHHVIDLGKPYLLQTLSPHNYLLTDAASISYISRAKYFDNFLMEISITISEYPSHHVVHCPGRCLSVISARNMHISSPV